ncbi:class I adenylate cyclase [Paraferrimonas sedimenticola]|uniref:Adenylate cyclase n=1 Tax=Paraferrimonas sedimenticola TaxID=375674 RepID=A0AA37RYK5_9GAMM|nr:class I adenylate cyclase [Paraferrimonas sedimenticola]GLP97478.1 adenylate cyclase [Paraferrimonas sedimenticola]
MNLALEPDLEFAFETAERVNRLRLQRAVALYSAHIEAKFALLPSLFHYHDPALPGFIEGDVPHGIEAFDQELSTAALRQNELLRPSHFFQGHADLLGIYVMGSSGTFGFSADSDIDLWVIYRAELQPRDLELLKLKCDRISDYFADFGMELNCYLVNPNQFVKGERCSIQEDASGSAQHWLLLDEFYRTHIKLAGLTVQWWPRAYGRSSLGLELGDLSQLPASEYFGATLWQLHKGQARPHKSLMKTLLLEAYSEEYPGGELLSTTLWRNACNGDYSCSNDPYVLLLARVSRYLSQHYDDDRLKLVRQGFYMKSGVRLSDPKQPRDWRYPYMEELVNEWGFSQHQIAFLDQAQYWDLNELQQMNQRVDEILLSSYNHLVKFAGNHHLDHELTLDDLGLLTRRLHTRFSTDPHQVERVNQLWSKATGEAILAIVPKDGAWQLNAHRVGSGPRCAPRPLKTSRHRLDLVLWAVLNKASKAKTQWRLGAPNSSEKPNKKSCKWLAQVAKHFRAPMRSFEKVSLAQLKAPTRLMKVSLVLNSEIDPTTELKGHSFALNVLGGSVFHMGKSKTNLLGSVALVTYSSWGAWRVQHYQGADALMAAASDLIDEPELDWEQIEIISASAKASRNLIEATRVRLQQAQSLTQCAQQEGPNELEWRVGDKAYELQFANGRLHWKEAPSSKHP